MLIGYARVSTLDQNPQLQIEALNAAGYKKIFTEIIPGQVPNGLSWKMLSIIGIMKNFHVASIVVLIWPLWYRDCSVQRLLQILFRS